MASSQQPFETSRNGIASILGGVAHMGRKAQEIAGEFVKMSEENLDAGSKAAERFRGARTLQDVTTIQTDLLKESYQTLNAHYRKIAEIAASTPQELAQNYNDFLSAVTKAGTEATQRAADVTRSATERGAAVVQRTAEAARDAGRR